MPADERPAAAFEAQMEELVMRRAAHLAVRTALIGCAVLAVGCENKDLKIRQLQEENDQLSADLTAVRADLSKAQEQLDQAKNQSVKLQSRISELEAALAKASQQARKQGEFTVLGPGVSWVSIPGNILFDPGKAALKRASRARLEAIARQIRTQYGDRDIFVIGHTDSDPIKVSGWKDNFELSCQRALAVLRQLVRLGLDPARVVAAGCGEHRPVADNRTSAGKRRNRRVEIFAVSKSFGSGGG
ncbi:MAG: OmpA family protein [Phycisphaerae bacterium]